jgi:hypothetical protein
VSASALASTSQLEETNLFIGEFDHETCRLCSVKSNGSFGIFSAKGVKKNLPALVKNYLNLEVRPVYPQSINFISLYKIHIYTLYL